MYSFRRTEGWYDGRPVVAGSTPSNLISAKSSISTNTSITRTGLLSSMKSSRHSGNSVHCPRSASSTKRLINSPIESRENHNSSTAFSHSQGHFRKSARAVARSALPPSTDVFSSTCQFRKVPLDSDVPRQALRAQLISLLLPFCLEGLCDRSGSGVGRDLMTPLINLR